MIASWVVGSGVVAFACDVTAVFDVWANDASSIIGFAFGSGTVASNAAVMSSPCGPMMRPTIVRPSSVVSAVAGFPFFDRPSLHLTNFHERANVGICCGDHCLDEWRRARASGKSLFPTMILRVADRCGPHQHDQSESGHRLTSGARADCFLQAAASVTCSFFYIDHH